MEVENKRDEKTDGVGMEGKCCICGEWTISIYSSTKHYSDGEVRRYTGHKGCLGQLDKLLIDEVEVEYVLINKGYDS